MQLKSRDTRLGGQERAKSAMKPSWTVGGGHAQRAVVYAGRETIWKDSKNTFALTDIEMKKEPFEFFLVWKEEKINMSKQLNIAP